VIEDQRGPAIRALDESQGPRRYWHGIDDDGSSWFFETVDDVGEPWAVKQLELTVDGRVHKYWWQHLEDASGFLTDQALAPRDSAMEDDLQEIDSVTFEGQWSSVECDCGEK
jgi:hypothetical protein